MRKRSFFLQRSQQWLEGSIRRKLTFFVVLLCTALISLVFMLAVRLLEPAYNTSIRREMQNTLEEVSETLNKAAKDGVPLVDQYQRQGLIFEALSDESITLLNERIVNGTLHLEDLCIDIGDEDCLNVFLRDQLPSKCLLHKSHGLLGEVVGINGQTVTELRHRVLEEGTIFYQVDNQMIMGTTAGEGQLTIIISANLERIPQAVQVLTRLMFVVSSVMLVFSVLWAYIFSKWFTKPLTELSVAAKEITKGNYEVKVPVKGQDEIATLSEDFNAMVREVKRSTELQRDLLANVSHDLRTPLTLIKGYAETIRDLTGDEPEKRKEQLNVIIDETDRLSALVGSVLELSRMSSGHEKIEKVEFDLTQLCDEVGFRYEMLCEKYGYHFDFLGIEGCMVEADPTLLERVLHNLLGNAVAHIGADGYIGLHVYKTPNNMVRVDVIDHGPGIPAEEIPLLFKRYYRSRAGAGKPGTGLGLSIVKLIFEAHQYTYGVDSQVGQGSVFWFEAPLL